MILRGALRRRETLHREFRRHRDRDDLAKKQLVALEAVSVRHSAHITIMWQAPSLGLAAEAFLLTIALAPSSSTFARVAVSVLGITVAVLASQFMAKHRHASQRDGQVLVDLVKDLGMTEMFRGAEKVKASWLGRRSSYLSWRIGLGICIIANATVLVLAVGYPEVFGGTSASPR